METFNNNSQQIGKNGKVKTFQQRVFSVEEDAASNNLPSQVNKNEPIALPELRKGSKGEMVMKAQRILKTTSDYIGYVDGDFGWVMESAVQSFQRRSKVAITGIINDDTWNALNQIRR
ncbi:peptidoglycan-binding domain-containing protein [Calothrix sp. CCY 0018]|uniref:peptidoglycan-binding domain-containing protein n=1 Tax=Calothrix sp. CCY 0018 TaxID=3103864 RepID=UPI0039C7069D